MSWFCTACPHGPWGTNDGHCHECGAQRPSSRKHNGASTLAQQRSAAELANQDQGGEGWYCPKCSDGPYGVIQDECQTFGCYGKKPTGCASNIVGPATSLASMVGLHTAVLPGSLSTTFKELWTTGESGSILRHSYRTQMRMRGKAMRACMAFESAMDNV